MSTSLPHPSMDENRIVSLITDAETGLLNETYFRLRLDEEFKKSWRYRWVCSLVLIEVEGLADVEAREGRQAADSLMLDVAGEVLTASRDVDLAARMGRSRFAMFLPGTPAEGARTMVQRVMTSVLERVAQRVSLGVGLTEAPQDALSTTDEFLARAQVALETAREQGRNQVVTWNTRSA
jgi:two-component system chemotaxis family response regulator WspR